MGERAQFMDEFVKQKLADDLAYQQYEQQMAGAEIDPREAMAAELELTRAKAGLTAAEGGVRGAEEANLRARTAILSDPVAMAAKQGRASADEMLAYQARVMEQARSEVDNFAVEQRAVDAVRLKLAPSLEQARAKIAASETAKKYNEILARDPQLQQILARAGMMMPGGSVQ